MTSKKQIPGCRKLIRGNACERNREGAGGGCESLDHHLIPVERGKEGRFRRKSQSDWNAVLIKP